MKVHGWGRYPTIEANLVEVKDMAAMHRLVADNIRTSPLIARGAGRSYGDCALAENIADIRLLDYFITFDEAQGRLTCAAGVRLEQILLVSVRRGWFLPVVPGTKFVTVGGAVASDVHGKNHHIDGCFSEFVTEFSLLLASGDEIKCSREENAELFHATCGGQGLTGIITTVSLKLRKISSAFITETTQTAGSLDEVINLFEIAKDSTYSVAWLDGMAKGKNLGRSLLFLGEHVTSGGLHPPQELHLSVPFRTPSFLINKYSMTAFHAFYHGAKRLQKKSRVAHYDEFFFPLDKIHNWNRLYGKSGFIQYQFVLPLETAREGIREVLNTLVDKGKGSFLTVLKKFGKANKNLLSFPIEGYTLTLDFKFEPELLGILDRLDDIVIAKGGRIFLAKDARMSEHTFKSSYPACWEFARIKQRVDPHSRFLSAQSRRLGISTLNAND